MKKTFKNLALIVGLNCIVPTALQAKDVKVFTDSNVPTPEELATIMLNDMPKTNSTPRGGASRGLSFVKPKQDKYKNISLPIKFDYNSSTLTTKSLTHLKKIGTMLNLDNMSDKHIVVVGHTDASGSKNYNLNLSKKRSQSVKEFLVSNYQIDPTRIKTTGKGESETLPGKPLSSSNNRRVEFAIK